MTLYSSQYGGTYYSNLTLEILHLTKMHKTVIHKNTPSVNSMLASVKELIRVQPVVFRTDIENSPTGGRCFWTMHTSSLLMKRSCQTSVIIKEHEKTKPLMKIVHVLQS